LNDIDWDKRKNNFYEIRRKICGKIVDMKAYYFYDESLLKNPIYLFNI